ncbi:uncharacterized protein LOC128218217 isoform X2 [Mya arenaria]|uniref:uncharacterized protein LOC128218217 isoform X2 n=1 Tax=Mya arenaria TaxID=6604 RepID=UPI0022E07036|nr:uncharacterized protein LOC128218217 isoform X2 [Mya arenaria]
MDNFGADILKARTMLVPDHVVSTRRRQTLHVTSFHRGKSALELSRSTASPIRHLTVRWESLTPVAKRRPSKNIHSSAGSLTTPRRLSFTPPNIKTRRSSSQPDAHLTAALSVVPKFSHRRGSVQLKVHTGSHGGGSISGQRRKSKIPAVTEEEWLDRKKRLMAKFRMAGRLAVFCSRNFKQHCLRINEADDELAPYIRRLHFHEDEATDDLLIDLSKFKANRQMRIPEKIKHILSKPQAERTEDELYHVVLGMRNLKSIAEYPNRMQRKFAQVGLYEKYESKRVVVRQGHPASAYYFILSGAVVVMVMDEESKYARPVAHLYKGQTFGELAIINGTKRNSTVICKETCEFMSISAQDYHRILMAGGVKNINDPDQEIFLRNLSCLSGWPLHLLPEHPSKSQFLYFKNKEVIVRDSLYSDWLIFVKSGSVQVLKKLKRVEPLEWKKKKKPEAMTDRQRRDVVIRRLEWRRFLPEVGVPLENGEEVELLSTGRPVPYQHPGPGSGDTTPRSQDTPTKRAPQIPNLWPFKVDLSEIKPVQYLDEYRTHSSLMHRARTTDGLQPPGADGQGGTLPRVKNRKGSRERSASIIKEEETELLGYQPHIRTIIEDIDPSLKRKEEEAEDERNVNPEFVNVQTLLKGQVFGLADVVLGEQPSLSVVSGGADVLLLNKQFYLEHASEKLLRDMRNELCPYPSDEELQARLQVSVDWHHFRKATLCRSVEAVTARRQMKHSLKGTKVQEAFAF